jgi:hypothetical protein
MALRLYVNVAGQRHTPYAMVLMVGQLLKLTMKYLKIQTLEKAGHGKENRNSKSLLYLL